MVFQRFQEDLNNWLNQGNNKQELDNIAKEVTGIPTVKVKDPQVFTQFIQDSNPQLPQPQPEPEAPVTQEPSQFIGKGGLIDPQRVKEFGLGLAELGSYGFGQAGEQFRNIDIDGQPLYEVGQVQQPLIDPQVAMEFAARAGGPEIPEAVPFLGGMTPAETLAGGAAYLTSPLDAAITAGTVGLGPAASAGIKATRAALPATTLGKGTKALLKPAELLVEPVAKGGVGKRLAGEVALTTPTLTTLAGTEKRKEEGIAYGFENAAAAIAVGLTGTVGGSALISKVNVPRIKNAFKSEDVALAASSLDGSNPNYAKEILDDPVFNAHYKAVTSNQKRFIDNYIKQTTKSSAITQSQKDFLYKKLLTTYNTNRLQKVADALPDTDPSKLELNEVLKTVEELKLKPRKNPAADYEETINPNLKGKVHDVVTSNGKVIKIFKASYKWDPDAKKGDAILNDTQQGILDRLITAVRTGNVQTATSIEQAGKERTRRIKKVRDAAYSETIERTGSVKQALNDAKKDEVDEIKRINIDGKGVTTKIEYRPKSAGIPTYKTIIPKTGIPEFIATINAKSTKFDVQETSIFNEDEVWQLQKAINENLLNNTDKMDAIKALIKLMGDPTYTEGQKRFATKTFKTTKKTPSGRDVPVEDTTIGIPRLTLEGQLPTGRDLQLLKKVFGKEFVDTINQFKRDPNQPSRGAQIFDAIWNIPRVLKATFDISALFLQAGFQVLIRPKVAARALGEGLKDMFRPITEAVFSPDFNYRKQQELFADKRVQDLIDAGLESTDRLSPVLSKREESFMPSIIEKLPAFTLLGPIVRGSSRFHSTFLNTVRADAGLTLYRQLEGLGTDMTPEILSDISKYVNWTTGRGPTNTPLGEIPPEVLAGANRLLFSARLQLSRIAFPFIGLPGFALSSGPIQKIVLKEKAQYYLLLGMILGLGKASGGDIDISKGKIRWGKISLDFDSGNNQYLELISDYVLTFGKDIFGKDMSKAKTGIPYTKDRSDLLLNAAKSKLNPAVSMLLEVGTGKDFYGDDINWTDYDPISISDKTLNFNGLKNIALKYIAPLNMVGVVETYKITSNPYLASIVGGLDSIGIMSNASINKNDIAQELFNLDFTELYPFEQRYVTTMFFADKRNQRDMPTSMQYELQFQKEMDLLQKKYTDGTYKKRQVVNEYFNAKQFRFIAKDISGNIIYKWDEQDKEDYDRDEYSAGNEAQQTALNEHYGIMDVEGVTIKDEKGEPTRLIDWDKYDEVKKRLKSKWTAEQQQFVDANTNIYEALIPSKIYFLLPERTRENIKKSIEARNVLLEGRYKPNLQTEFNEAFDRLNNK